MFAVIEFLIHKSENIKMGMFLSWQVYYQFEENGCFSWSSCLLRGFYCAYQVLETSVSHNELDGRWAWFEVAVFVVWICPLQFDVCLERKQTEYTCNICRYASISLCKALKGLWILKWHLFQRNVKHVFVLFQTKYWSVVFNYGWSISERLRCKIYTLNCGSVGMFCYLSSSFYCYQQP